jgi:hypothetical protein
MSTTIEHIEEAIGEATAPGFRARLIARGQARAIIWRDGVLPADAPTFSTKLSYDLYSYGFGLLGLGLRLREMGGDMTRARRAFEYAATALESVVAKGRHDDRDRNFHFVMASACYHLAHLSARAYSLLAIVQSEENFSLIERALALLILRDFNALEELTLKFRVDGVGSDSTIIATFQADWAASEKVHRLADDEDSVVLDGLALALTDNFFGAIATFLLALERGERSLLEKALNQLHEGVVISGEFNFLPQWWTYKLAVHLLSDLWESTFHEMLPLLPAGGEAQDWVSLRELFIATLTVICNPVVQIAAFKQPVYCAQFPAVFQG